jgi:hypothetical protein
MLCRQVSDGTTNRFLDGRYFLFVMDEPGNLPLVLPVCLREEREAPNVELFLF